MRIFLMLILLAAIRLAERAFGIWKVNPIRSTDPPAREPYRAV
jgi:hypothetical protein